MNVSFDTLTAARDLEAAGLGAQITELKAEMKAGFSEVNSRIDTLEKVVWRVIWPLIVLLAAPIFGLLYKALTD